MNKNAIPTLEWIYTLQKNIIEKVFNQPARAYHNSEKQCIHRIDCVDAYLYWAETNEGGEYWSRLSGRLTN